MDFSYTQTYHQICSYSNCCCVIGYSSCRWCHFIQTSRRVSRLQRSRKRICDRIYLDYNQLRMYVCREVFKQQWIMCEILSRVPRIISIVFDFKMLDRQQEIQQQLWWVEMNSNIVCRIDFSRNHRFLLIQCLVQRQLANQRMNQLNWMLKFILHHHHNHRHRNQIEKVRFRWISYL